MAITQPQVYPQLTDGVENRYADNVSLSYGLRS
jgi:hypothetical protein